MINYSPVRISCGRIFLILKKAGDSDLIHLKSEG